MPKVWNWQIGRDMEYPYEGAYPRRQFAFVFNTNRCIACQTCTMACKSTWTFSRGQEYMWWNNVETKPYGGYPQHWDVKTLSLLAKADPEGRQWEKRPGGDTFPGKTIFDAAGAIPELGQQRVLGYLPSEDEWRHPNIHEDVARGPEGKRYMSNAGQGDAVHENMWFFYLQRLCNHCSYPACLAACPRQAIYKRPEDGIVLIDQERCRGYRKCMEACPYKKAMFRPETRTSEKCIGCYPRVEGKDPLSKGLPMETRCMSSCVGKIRIQGTVAIDGKTGDWAEDRQNPLYYLVKVAKVALPLYPQMGTEPNGYYIPPRWVPRPYLKQMFGPGVDLAIERYVAPDRELLAVMQLFRASQQIIHRYEIKEGPRAFETKLNGKPWALYNDTVIGYAHDGSKIVELTVEEPVHERPAKHQNSI